LGARLRALVVEDNQGDAALLRAYLAADVDLLHEDTLAGACTRLASETVDAVLLDLGLPDSQGLESVRAILRAAPAVPIVVLTGHDDDELGAQAMQVGAQDFQSKAGCDSRSLLRALRYAVERGRLQEQTREIILRNVDAMIVVSEQGTIRFVNRAAEVLFDREGTDLVDQTFPYPINDRSTRDIEVVRRDGEIRLAQMRMARLQWDGQGAVLASIRDITDIRRAQDLEQRLLHADRLASIGQLAAGVAHEVNNPASFVLGNIGVLGARSKALRATVGAMRSRLGSHLDAEGRAAFDAVLAEFRVARTLDEIDDMLSDCSDGIQRICSTVKELNAFARIERDEVEVVDVNDVCAVACSIAANEIRHRARLVQNLARVPHIAADRPKLTQVIINLLVNAAHAIGDGSTMDNFVRVETFQRERSIVIAVVDSGSGISETNQRRLFEPFFTTKPRGLGTGLGLSISAETVRKHGGEIRVTSKLGEGSRFEVVLPDVTGLEPSRRAAQAAPTASPISARILVVDDEPMLRKALRRMLDPPHRVALAESGIEALRMLTEQSTFDVVLCDMMMPGMDGPTFMRAAVQEHPELASRFVFMTGGAITSAAKAFLAEERPLVLDKPISEHLLYGIIERIAGKTDA
jgi:PAS domain S-box-containing protein